MKEIDETITFLEEKLQELRRLKQKNRDKIDREDMIEQRLERIENAVVEILKGIVG